MSAKPLILAVMGATSVAAAAAGGYLALRVNSADRLAATATTETSVPAQSVPATAATAEPAATAPTARATISPSEPRASRATAAPGSRVGPKSAPPVPQASGDSSPAPASPPTALPPTTTAPPTSDPPPPVVDRNDPPPVSQEPPKPQFDELTVTQDAVIGIRLDGVISTETAKVEDKVTARVARDVVVAGRTAIPSGARLEGTVTTVERGGKFKNQARLGVRFETLILAGNTRVTLRTETIFRNGEPPAGEASTKVGASAVVGAILGAVIGGKKGAVIGGTVGAAGGTAAVMAGSASEASIPAGTLLTVRLTAPVTIVVERRPSIL